jgi:hypothetical protein
MPMRRWRVWRSTLDSPGKMGSKGLDKDEDLFGGNRRFCLGFLLMIPLGMLFDVITGPFSSDC